MLQHMISAFEVQGLKPADKLLLLAFADHANDKGECWPSLSTLARKTSLSIRTVQRSIKTLQDAGYLRVQNRCSDEKGLMSNLYTISLDPNANLSPPIDTVTPPYGHNDHTPIVTMTNKATNKKLPVEVSNMRFTAPTVEQVAEYCTERNNNVDAQRFIDYYSSNGWKVGRNKMKCWKSAVRNWERNSKTNATKQERHEALNHAINDYQTAKYNW